MHSPMGNGDASVRRDEKAITLCRPVTVKRTTIADERLGVVRQTIIYLDSARADFGQDTNPNEMVFTSNRSERLPTEHDQMKL